MLLGNANTVVDDVLVAVSLFRDEKKKNNPKKRDELEFSWATTVDKGGR